MPTDETIDARPVSTQTTEVTFHLATGLTLRYLSPSWLALSDRHVDETLGESIVAMVWPEDRDQMIEVLDRGGHEPIRAEVRIVRPDGGFRWVDMEIRCLFTDTGLRSGFNGTMRDITGRRLLSSSVQDMERSSGQTERSLSKASEPSLECIRFDGKVLLAEDSQDSQRLVNYLLKRCGLDVSIVDNGRSAVEAVIDAASRASGFDAVVMDLEMPEVDGIDAVRELRERGLSALPVIALTAHALPADRDRCIAAGFDDYIAKPVDRASLARVLSRFLPPLNQQAPTSSSGSDRVSVSRSTGSKRPHRPSVNSKLSSRFASNPEMKEILDVFVAELANRVVQIQTRWASRDADGLRRLMHDLKGAGGGYGFDEITALAASAEMAIRLRADDAAIRGAVEQVISILRRVDGYDLSREAA